ncbi:MAG: SufD family Fe-S cluster assembly protein [Planctomycetes bacterium]|nr:SufD family Fe-S cluster assembly protein [Planctomycetota bacterium]
MCLFQKPATCAIPWRLTHEAAIGSADSGRLQTLMGRGMDESKAVELIVRGMLRRK